MQAEPDPVEPTHEREAGQGPDGAVVRRRGVWAAALFTGCWPRLGIRREHRGWSTLDILLL